jgi:hypothetical protein
MSRVSWVLLFAAAACGGTLPLDASDAGVDADAEAADAADAAPSDVNAVDDVSPDSPPDAVSDVQTGDAADSDSGAVSAPWALSIGGGALWAVDVDAQQDIAVSGMSTPSNGYNRFFVEKLDAGGSVLWTKSAGTSTYGVAHIGLAVAFDTAGDVYAAGLTSDALDVGGGAKGPGAFVVKYDSGGTFVWEYGPFPATTFSNLRVKSTGNVVVAGETHGANDFGGGTVTSAGNNDALLVEITSSGSYVRARAWGDAGYQMFMSLALDSSDDVFLAGELEGTVDFGGGAMTGGSAGSGAYDSFLLELDPSASYLRQLDTKMQTSGVGFAGITTANGHVFVAGASAKNTGLSLGGGLLDCGGAFVAELDSSFGHAWSSCYANAYGGKVAADSSGGVALAGGYSGNVDFGQGTLPPYRGAYLAGFGSNGTPYASWGTGSPQNYPEVAHDIAYLTAPDFVVVGGCAVSALFPSGTLTCGVNGDGFVARLAP